MCRRNIEPRKGYWTLPAGFLENGETDGRRRPPGNPRGNRRSTVTDLVPYLMVDIVHIHQIYLMFRSRSAGTRLPPHPGKFRGKTAADEADIPWDDIAFKVIEKTLRRYFQDRPSGAFCLPDRPNRKTRLDQKLIPDRMVNPAGSQKLAELDTYPHALPADHAGGGIRIFEKMPHGFALEFKIHGPGVVGRIPFHGHLVVTSTKFGIYFRYFLT
jgi:hypothetical protein